MEIWKTAWRNVLRSRRRTYVTVSAMSFALWVMVLYSGLVAGYLRDMERSILDLEIGDLQVHAGDYQEDPSLYARIDDPEALLGQLQEQGFQATPRLLAWGMAAADESSAGVSFRGVEVAQDAQVSRIYEHVMEGSWLDPADPQGVVLGRRLARMLGVALGEEIVVLSQGADGATAADLFTVRGVLQSIADATDRAAVFMTAGAFRELFVVPLGAHQIVVRRPAEVELDAAAVAVRELALGLDVQTWRDLMPTLASMLDSARGAMLAMFFIVYLAIAVLILNAMLMAVFERIRELGVLKALGVGPAGIAGLVWAEAVILTAISVVVGLMLGVPTLLYLAIYGIELTSMAGVSVMGMAMDPMWRAELSIDVVVAPVGALVAIVSLAVVYPSLKAAWIDPVRAIYHR
ncbi:MAG: ABC transporter permease [bacterium]|nr:ABC transporter permease [bacterium]MCP5068795.1 ABC transporter permease [bacterium]